MADSRPSGTGVEVYWLLGWTAVGLALAPLGAVVGGVVGAVKAPPREQVERSKAALVDAVGAADLPATIRNESIRLGSERSWHTLVPLTGQGPEAGDHDVGSVLEIFIRHVGLTGRMDSATGKPVSVWIDLDPELELRLEVDARLIKTSDGTVLYSRSFREFGAVRTFSAWAADDGRAFRTGIAQSSERVADEITKAFFPAPELPTETRETGSKPEPSAESGEIGSTGRSNP